MGGESTTRTAPHGGGTSTSTGPVGSRTGQRLSGLAVALGLVLFLGGFAWGAVLYRPYTVPTSSMTPTIDALATDYEGRAKIGKLNVDHNNGTAARYNIRGIPTILLFKGGKVVDQKVGALPKSELTKMLDAHLGS